MEGERPQRGATENNRQESGLERTKRTLPRIYVACLASYNQGVLHGLWIEADQEPEELRANIEAMLASSPMVGAEEYAIHDHEGFAGFEIGEHEDLAVVSRVARGIAGHGEAMAAFLAQVGSSAEAVDQFHDRFVGTFASAEDWARQIGDDLQWEHQLEQRLDPDLAPYVSIDYQAYARDLANQWWVIEGEEGTHVYAP